MSSKTKIVVLHMKEVVYTAIFLVLAVIMIVVLFLMFGSNKDSKTSSNLFDGSSPSVQYVSGVYTSMIELNNNTFDVQVTVDSNHINSIELVNLSESTAAMYPLIQPTLEKLASQIYTSQSLENIIYEDESKYTSMLLMRAITSALNKAKVKSS